MRATKTRDIGTLLLTAMIVGCEQTPIGLPEATSLIVTPEELQLVAGDIATVSGQILDQQGRVLRGAVVSWSSNAPSVGRVTPDGVVTAVAPGTASVVASYGSLQAELPVTVVRDERDILAALEISRTVLSTDRRAGEQFVAYRAFDGRGRPRCDVPLELTVSDRSVASASQVTGCRIRITPIGPGQTAVIASSAGTTASFTVDVTLGGQIAFFSARPELAELRAGNTVTYRVRLLDGNDEPISNHTVNFDVTIGTLATASTTTDEQGYATVQWRLPRMLRQRTPGGDVEYGSIMFRTQLAGYVHGEVESSQIMPGPAASVAFATGRTSSGLTFRAPGDTWQAPLYETALILAESRDEHGNRRDPGQLQFGVDGQPIFFLQTVWVGDRYLRGITRYESAARTIRVTARDGDLSADLTVEFTAGS